MGWLKKRKQKRIIRQIIDGVYDINELDRLAMEFMGAWEMFPMIKKSDLEGKFLKGFLKYSFEHEEQENAAIEILNQYFMPISNEFIDSLDIDQILKLLWYPRMSSVVAEKIAEVDPYKYEIKKIHPGIPDEPYIKILVLLSLIKNTNRVTGDATSLKSVISMRDKVPPVIEQFMMKIPESEWLSNRELSHIFLSCILVYKELKVSPSEEFFKYLTKMCSSKPSRGIDSYTNNAYEFASAILKNYSMSEDEMIDAIVVGGVRRTEAIKKCSENNIKGDKLVQALAEVANDNSVPFARIEAVKYLGRLGAEAKSAIPALKKVMTYAGRMLNEEDFVHQKQVYGELTESVKDRISKGDMLDSELFYAAEDALKLIEGA